MSSDTEIRNQIEPHLQRLQEIVSDDFQACNNGGDAGLLDYVADVLDEHVELLAVCKKWRAAEVQMAAITLGIRQGNLLEAEESVDDATTQLRIQVDQTGLIGN